MFELICNARRTKHFAGSLYESDGETGVALAATDAMRFKMGAAGKAPLIDILAGTANANGSLLTITDRTSPAAYTLRLAAADLTYDEDAETGIAPGTYDAEIIVVDDSDSDAVLHVEQGIVHVLPTMIGNVSLS